MITEFSNQRLWESVFESFSEGLMVLDAAGHLVLMNSAGESLVGMSRETLAQKSLKDIFGKDEMVLVHLNKAITDHTAATLRDMPWRHRGPQARTILDITMTPLRGERDDAQWWLLVLRDVTPIKKLEDDVRKSDRLAMMGTIAAGLAHEIKNPLGGIKGAAQLLARQNQSEDNKEYLQIIIKEVERVDRLVSQLLTFARPKELHMEPVNINELADSLLLLQKERIEKYHVQLIREYDPSLPPILGDADELKQVFLNFIKNSLDAVSERYPEGGGILKIRTRIMTSFKIKGAEGKKPSRMVVVEIEDNGSGISQENLGKIFTPFFTTKEKGYGLGLAIAQRVVNEHGGLIHVTSEVDQGTSFQILLRSAL